VGPTAMAPTSFCTAFGGGGGGGDDLEPLWDTGGGGDFVFGGGGDFAAFFGAVGLLRVQARVGQQRQHQIRLDVGLATRHGRDAS